MTRPSSSPESIYKTNNNSIISIIVIIIIMPRCGDRTTTRIPGAIRGYNVILDKLRGECTTAPIDDVAEGPHLVCVQWRGGAVAVSRLDSAQGSMFNPAEPRSRCMPVQGSSAR